MKYLDNLTQLLWHEPLPDKTVKINPENLMSTLCTMWYTFVSILAPRICCYIKEYIYKMICIFLMYLSFRQLLPKNILIDFFEKIPFDHKWKKKG